jgi:hypothetical protein
MSSSEDITVKITEEQEVLPKMLPDQKPKEDFEEDSVISVAQSPFQEPDNLNEMDNTQITPLKSDPEEIIRLFRSITNLTPLQIRIIELRYLNLLKSYSTRIFYVDCAHHFTRSFVSLGSVIVPALLSIQSPTSPTSVTLYWTTWLISLLVTSFHNIITIFRFDKKYFALHNTYERLQNEGWSYLQLSSRYAGHRSENEAFQPTHKNQFKLFVNTIEKIQMRQIYNEYNGQPDEKQSQHQVQPQQNGALLPSPLENPRHNQKK